jgi:nucleoside-diphosphate-sugar epimerase
MGRSPCILVTGATGMVGVEMIRACAARRPAVVPRVLVQPSLAAARALWPLRDAVEVCWGDLRDPEAVARAVRGVDVVIHAAAVLPPLADERPALADAVNVDGTANVLAAMAAAGGSARLVYTSSISVYGDRLESPWIRVGDPLSPSPGDYYARTKLRAEALIRDAGVPATILRLTAIMSPTMRPNPLMFHMPLGTSLEICSARDCAFALVEAAFHPELVGRTLNLGGGPRGRTTYRVFLGRMLEIFGLGADLLPDEAFAPGDFHCGFYADSDELDAVVHHQAESLDDIYQQFAAAWPAPLRVAARLGRPVARAHMLSGSTWYRASRAPQAASSR